VSGATPSSALRRPEAAPPEPAAKASALARARVFVAASGTPFDRLRLEALLDPRRAPEVEAALGRREADGGGYARAEGGAASLGATLDTLGIFDDLRALRAPGVERAVRYLAATQQPDGSWHDTDAGASDPSVTTAMAGGFLAKTPCARPQLLAAAGAFLGRAFSPERLSGDLAAIAAFAHFFAVVPHELSDAALQWCGRELERGYRTGRFAPQRAARVFLLSRSRALPGARVTLGETARALVASQDADGGWAAAAGAEGVARVAETLEAATALAALHPEVEPR
jgi:hypothetical protein